MHVSVSTMQEEAIQSFRVDPHFANAPQTVPFTALDLKSRDTGYLAGISLKPQMHFDLPAIALIKLSICHNPAIIRIAPQSRTGSTR